jgi:hypothetical protein
MVVVPVVIPIVWAAPLVVLIAGPAFGLIGTSRFVVTPVVYSFVLPIGRIGIANCLTR